MQQHGVYVKRRHLCESGITSKDAAQRMRGSSKKIFAVAGALSVAILCSSGASARPAPAHASDMPGMDLSVLSVTPMNLSSRPHRTCRPYTPCSSKRCLSAPGKN